MFKKQLCITLITFKFFPNKKLNTVNVFSNRKKIFTVIKQAKVNCNVITVDRYTFEYLDVFDRTEYQKYFLTENKNMNKSKVYIFYKVKYLGVNSSLKKRTLQTVYLKI